MRRERSKTHPATSQPRPHRRIYDETPDSYGLPGKLPDQTLCPGCRAVYREGRWTWVERAVGQAEALCPACRRIRDRYPAGSLWISGAFATAHREEIEHLLRHVEQREKTQHPLERIMDLRVEGESLRVDTTGVRLVHSLGRALHHAYQGELDLAPTGAERPIRVHWRRR